MAVYRVYKKNKKWYVIVIIIIIIVILQNTHIRLTEWRLKLHSLISQYYSHLLLHHYQTKFRCTMAVQYIPTVGLCVMTPCSLVCGYQLSEQYFLPCAIYKGGNPFLQLSVNFSQTIRGHFWECGSFHSHSCKSLKSSCTSLIVSHE
jgi:hypothetical protein